MAAKEDEGEEELVEAEHQEEAKHQEEDARMEEVEKGREEKEREEVGLEEGEVLYLLGVLQL